MNLAQVLRLHTVTVRPRAGAGAFGDTYGPSFPLQCFAEGRMRMVAGPDGNQATSSLTLYSRDVQAEAVPPGSLVTWRGRTSKVILAVPHDSGGLAPEVDHTEVACE